LKVNHFLEKEGCAMPIIQTMNQHTDDTRRIDLNHIMYLEGSQRVNATTSTAHPVLNVVVAVPVTSSIVFNTQIIGRENQPADSLETQKRPLFDEEWGKGGVQRADESPTKWMGVNGGLPLWLSLRQGCPISMRDWRDWYV
jgi:hypothetical protein